MNTLIYRMIIQNILGFCILGYLWWLGLVDRAREGDPTQIVEICFAVFLFTLGAVIHKAWQVNQLQKSGKRFNHTSFLARQAWLDDVPEILASLGLLGTVIGVVDGMHGISTGDIQSIYDAISTAGWTTASSIVLYVWAIVNRRVLFTSSVLLTEQKDESA